MKQFKFNLEPVLDQRKRQHDKAQETLAKAALHCRQGEEELRAIEREKQKKRDDFKNEQKGALDISSLVQHLRYLTYLGRSSKIKAEDLVLRQEEVARCKEAMIRIFRDKKAIEKLKEKRQQEYMTDVRAAEQKSIDETATGRYIRAKHTYGKI